MERVFDARGCHSRKNDGLEEKEKKRQTQKIIFYLILLLQDKRYEAKLSSGKWLKLCR